MASNLKMELVLDALDMALSPSADRGESSATPIKAASTPRPPSADAAVKRCWGQLEISHFVATENCTLWGCSGGAGPSRSWG